MTAVDRAEGVVVCVGERENELVAAECAALTGSMPDRSFLHAAARRADIRRLPQAAYLRYGMRLIAEAPTLDALCRELRARAVAADGFRIEFHRLNPDAPYKRMESIAAAADAIEGRPNLSEPSVRFLLAAGRRTVLFGHLETEPTRSYEAHERKPWRMSSSLPARLARGMVNLAPNARTLLNLCCGSGSLLLEAAALGMRAVGCDLNMKMVGMTLQNARHFEYEIEAFKADARTLDCRADAVVVDLPYGKNLQADAANLQAIMNNAARLSPFAVIAACADLRPWMRAAGFEDVRVYRAPKNAFFTRHIHTGVSAEKRGLGAFCGYDSKNARLNAGGSGS